MSESKKPRVRSSKTLEDLTREISPLEQARTDKKMMLALKIAQVLERKSWNSKRFAMEMNQQPSVISKWLSGTHNFTAETLSDIEEKLGIELLAVHEAGQAVTRIQTYRTTVKSTAVVAERSVHPYRNAGGIKKMADSKKPFMYG